MCIRDSRITEQSTPWFGTPTSGLETEWAVFLQPCSSPGENRSLSVSPPVSLFKLINTKQTLFRVLRRHCFWSFLVSVFVYVVWICGDLLLPCICYTQRACTCVLRSEMLQIFNFVGGLYIDTCLTYDSVRFIIFGVYRDGIHTAELSFWFWRWPVCTSLCSYKPCQQ